MPKKILYDDVKKYIESFDYMLLSKTYKNAKQKLLIKCPLGHKYKVSWCNFKNKYRCPICAGNKKLSYKDVKDYIEKEGYQLLSDTYKNAQSKLKVICPKRHEYDVRFYNFKNGKRCPICKGGIKLTYLYVNSFIEREGYQLLSNDYKNNRVKLLLKCPEGHEYKANFRDFQQGNRCPFCSNNTSKGEIELQDYVESLGYDIIRNDRTQIINPLTNKNLELDIWIPSLNKAIEYNGTYWHSLNERIKCDSIKKDQCKQKGIDLLIVNDEKWSNCKKIEQKIIKNFLKGI